MQRFNALGGFLGAWLVVVAGGLASACSSDAFDSDCASTGTCPGTGGAAGDGSSGDSGGGGAAGDASTGSDSDATVPDGSDAAKDGDASVDSDASVDAEAGDAQSEEAASPQPNGAACASDATCASQHCVDGRCCGDACTGTCMRCDVQGFEGTCTAVGKGHDPDQECLGTGSANGPCIGACDGQGACSFPATTVSCGASSCTSGTQTDARCSGDGACKDVETSCGLFACGASECKATCASAGDCAPNAFCSQGSCVAKLDLGSACTGTDQCGSGHCVDGVCCDSGCSGQCMRCNLNVQGHCQAIASGSDPDSECLGSGSPGGACIGTCDGAGACKFPPATQSCGTATCSAGTETDPLCSGNGACVPVQKSCGAYACSGASCGTSCGSDASCAGSAFCAGAVCQAKKANGASCGGDNQCTSGHCVGGTCCGTACAAPNSCDTGTCLCNGTTCSNGHQCTVWYLDQDDDTYPASSQYNKTACNDQKPPSVNSHNYYDSATTANLDCYDSNKLAFPGQVKFFPTNRGDGSFDYDCDGQETKQYPNVNGSTCACQKCDATNIYRAIFGSCPGTHDGYTGFIACGQSATLQSCTDTNPDLYGCSAAVTTTPSTPQPCR